jgi:CYTH domain
MKASSKFYVAFLGFMITLCRIGMPAYAQGEFDPGDYDALRIENEIKLVVPREIQDEVWVYLQKRYAPPSTFLAGIDSSLHAVFALDRFSDQYFDNADFQLVRMASGVRHRTRQVLTDTTSRKNGRELMQIKINNIDQNDLNRGEYKYPVKHYKPGGKVVEHDEHPMLGLVKRKNRAGIIEKLQLNGVDALSLAPTILITQYRKRLYVYKDSSAFATLTLDIDTASYLGDQALFTELEMELNEIAYTNGDTSKRAEMEQVNSVFRQDLLQQFPAIHQDQTPKYNKAAAAFGIDPENGKYGKRPWPWLWIGGIAGALLFFGGVVLLFRWRASKFEAEKRQFFEMSGSAGKASGQ